KTDRRLGASLWHFAVQRVLQVEAGRHPATLDGALAHLQQFGGLGLAQPLIPEQIDDLTLLRRQSIDLLVERAPGRESLRLMRHIGWVRRRQATAECRIAGLGGMAGPPPPPAAGGLWPGRDIAAEWRRR